MDPYDMIKKVDSLETFLKFLKALADDKEDEDRKEKIEPSSPYSQGHNGWEHNDIASYLDAMHAGTSDNNFPQEASWKSFARIIYMGKVYE